MEMTNVSSAHLVNTKENNSGKKESKPGEFESIIKILMPEDQKTEENNKEEGLEIPVSLFMGGTMTETNDYSLLSLKGLEDRQIHSDLKGIVKEQVLIEGTVQKEISAEIPKDMQTKDESIKSLKSGPMAETKTLDKTKEVSSQNTEIKGKLDSGVKLEKEPKVFSQAYREVELPQKLDGEKQDKTVVFGKTTEQILETNIKKGPNIEKTNLEKNDGATLFSLEKTLSPLKTDGQAPILKTSQDNIIKVQDAMIKLFETSQEGETTRMKVSLHPENLGKVDIGLKMEDGKLTASILVENNQVRDLFTNKLGELNQSLAKQNLIIEKIHIEVKNQGPNLQMNMDGQGNFNQGGKRQQETRMHNIFRSEYKDFKEIKSISLEKGVSILA